MVGKNRGGEKLVAKNSGEDACQSSTDISGLLHASFPEDRSNSFHIVHIIIFV